MKNLIVLPLALVVAGGVRAAPPDESSRTSECSFVDRAESISRANDQRIAAEKVGLWLAASMVLEIGLIAYGLGDTFAYARSTDIETDSDAKAQARVFTNLGLVGAGVAGSFVTLGFTFWNAADLAEKEATLEGEIRSLRACQASVQHSAIAPMEPASPSPNAPSDG